MEKATEKKSSESMDTWFKLQKEFIESWTKSQKEFIESWTRSQEELMDNWLAAASKFQEFIFKIDGRKEGAPGKEMLRLYNTWFDTMANSSRIFTDEAMKMQGAWKSAVEKQMGMSRDVFKKFSEFSQQEGTK